MFNLFKYNKLVLKYKVQIRNYNRSFNNNKLIKDKKYFVPAIKEWPDSVYSFNKNNLKDLPSKDKLVNKLIKKFFYLLKKKSYNFRSKRMRNLIIKSKVNRLWLSKPEIKQTSDKNIITVHMYDREKKSFVKKFFFYKRKFRNTYNKKFDYKRKLFTIKRLPLVGRRLMLETKLYEEKLFNKIDIFRKNKYKDILFKYLFLKWILSLLNFRINHFFTTFESNKRNKFIVISKSINMTIYEEDFLNNSGFIYKNEKGLNKLFQGYLLRKNRLFKYNHNYIINSTYFKDINDETNFLFMFLKETLIIDNLNKINFIYYYYKKIYYKIFIGNVLLKRIKLNRLRKFHINNLRFNKYLPFLKLWLNKIYNKKIELNLINLEYPYLNSDIFVHVLATKLRDRTRKFITVLEGYLNMIKLIKMPLQLKNNIKNKYLIEKKFIIDKENNIKTRNINNLINIKSKWITGIRLEAAGRLTNRYVAQRSIYKYKYKGNLRSIESKYTKIRTFVNPNIQKSYIQSIRRIGAFGIKGWISSN